MGSLEQVFKRQKPLDLDIALSSELINFKVQGNIAEPLQGEGIDLKVQGNISQLRDIKMIKYFFVIK